jgi:hypothetical protein
MQPISEIPSFFAKRFAQLCCSVVKSEVEEIRPANLKDSARYLVEDVLSGFPDLVPTDALEVFLHFMLAAVLILECDLINAVFCCRNKSKSVARLN